MIHVHQGGAVYRGGKWTPAPEALGEREKTLACRILRAHDCLGEKDRLSIRFDKLISHDITYVGIIQTARASGMTRFPVPYALTNCHNSLCAVGGTINEDDHLFGLSAARKYGGIYVPANVAVIHQFAREMLAECGGMILGSDSHTRYGALGAMGVGEGGPELVKQLLENTWDAPNPEVVLVYLTGKPRRGVGPHDVAIALCGATYRQGLVKNKVLEFAGPGLASLSMDFRIGIDVMTTETACLSSIWETDGKTRSWYARHGREDAYKQLSVPDGAYYDMVIEIDLSRVEPMIALPFHPSNAFTVRQLKENAADILRETEKALAPQLDGKAPDLTGKVHGGQLRVDQGIIAGCAGGIFENVAEAAAILKDQSVGCGAFSLSVYPPSLPESIALSKAGALVTLEEAGALIKSCFCGPCFGAGDVPGNGQLSIRHTTRNFPFREGAKPGEGQSAFVALMDARSIAATAANGGVLTGADEIEYDAPGENRAEIPMDVYRKRVYSGFGAPIPDEPLRMGPNITDWPRFTALDESLRLTVASVLNDPVTTTDELIPSGETSSYRSNPIRLSEFALSRRDPQYVSRSKASRRDAENGIGFGSLIYANMPGDGSAREQAASCQRVVGGRANIARAYATKRYRSNLINWGILPFTIEQEYAFSVGDVVEIDGIREMVKRGAEEIAARVVHADGSKDCITLYLKDLDQPSRRILLNGCLMNDYAARGGKGEKA